MGRGIFNSVPDETSFEGAVTEQPPVQSLYNGGLVFGRFYWKKYRIVGVLVVPRF
jgi:hypothetical protein